MYSLNRCCVLEFPCEVAAGNLELYWEVETDRQAQLLLRGNTYIESLFRQMHASNNWHNTTCNWFVLWKWHSQQKNHCRPVLFPLGLSDCLPCTNIKLIEIVGYRLGYRVYMDIKLVCEHSDQVQYSLPSICYTGVQCSGDDCIIVCSPLYLSLS